MSLVFVFSGSFQFTKAYAACIVLRINDLIVVCESLQHWLRLGKSWCFQKPFKGCSFLVTFGRLVSNIHILAFARGGSFAYQNSKFVPYEKKKGDNVEFTEAEISAGNCG